jgi:23S rRNA (guanosine2251-2'-O)-methyltransferase
VDNIVATIKDIKNNGIRVIGLDGSASHFIHESDTKMPLALVAGSEDEGIELAVQRQLDELVKLPMHPELESYNVSVAAAMALYEIHRQRI